MLLIVVISQIHAWKICLSFWWLTCFGSVVNTLIKKSLNIRFCFSQLKQTIAQRSLKSWNLIMTEAFFSIFFTFRSFSHLIFILLPSFSLPDNIMLDEMEWVSKNVLQTSVYNLTSDWFILEHLVSHTRVRCVCQLDSSFRMFLGLLILFLQILYHQEKRNVSSSYYN